MTTDPQVILALDTLVDQQRDIINLLQELVEQGQPPVLRKPVFTIPQNEE